MMPTLLLSGCAIDQRKKVAYDLLYQPDGFENKAAFDAVVRARFARGTNVEELRAFFARNLGDCTSDEKNRVVCEAPIRTGACWARLMKIDAVVEDDKIATISVLVGGIGC
ncbi:MAG: hypothetical protein ABIN56_00805 [Dokdonella sp.]